MSVYLSLVLPMESAHWHLCSTPPGTMQSCLQVPTVPDRLAFHMGHMEVQELLQVTQLMCISVLRVHVTAQLQCKKTAA